MTERMSVLDRTKNLCVLSFPDEPTTESYQILAANTLDGAFSGGSILVPYVRKKSHYISTGLRRSKRFYTSDNTVNQTRVIFDFDEFQGATYPLVPTDTQFAYLTVKRTLITTGLLGDEGPVYIVPDSKFNNMQTPSATIAGTAPVVVGTINGVLPLEGSLEIVMPRFLGSFTLRNLDDTNSVFFSFGLNMPMVELPGNGSTNLTGTQSETLVLASIAGPATFNLIGGVENASI